MIKRVGEKSVNAYCEVFGYTARNKVASEFLCFRGLDMSLAGLASGSDIPKQTVYLAVKRLVSEGVVVPTRKVGKLQYYKLNGKSSKARVMVGAMDLVIKDVIENQGRTE